MATPRMATSRIALSVPSFKANAPSSEAASRVMRANRAADTKAELLLRSELHSRGIRYRLHRLDLPGKPDIVFPRHRIAVFCDGDFWHGRNWITRRQRLLQGANGPYWVAKIEYNIERDVVQTRELIKLGWTVARYWETDIIAAPSAVADELERMIRRACKVEAPT